jgi:hypothetical protein
MDLVEVQKLAALLFTEEEIFIILTRDEDVKNFDDAYQKGRLLSIMEVRRSIFNMAKQGSSPAQKEWLFIERLTAKKK